MGIKGLTKLLRTKAPRAIEKLCPRGSDLEARFRGKTFVLDTAIFMYKFMYGCHGGAGPTVADKFLELAGGLDGIGVTPFFVFDGVAPLEKAATHEARTAERDRGKVRLATKRKAVDTLEEAVAKKRRGSRTAEDSLETAALVTALVKARDVKVRAERCDFTVTPADFTIVRGALEGAGFRCYTARDEGEKGCAFIAALLDARERGSAIAVTEDMDALPFGAPCVFRNLTLRLLTPDIEPAWPTKPGMAPFLIHREALLEGLHIGPATFVDLCIMCGSDFTGTKPRGIGPVKALEALRISGTIEEFLSSDPRGRKFAADPAFMAAFDYGAARRIFALGPSEVEPPL